MLLRRLQLDLGLQHRQARIIHQFLRDRSLALCRRTIVVQLLGRPQRFLCSLHIRLRPIPVIHHRRPAQQVVGGLRLLILILALIGCRGQIRALQHHHQLACTNVIASIDQDFRDRRGDLRRHRSLVHRIQDRVSGHHSIDCALYRRLHRHRRRSLTFGLGCLGLALAAAGKNTSGKNNGDHARSRKKMFIHDYKIPLSVCSVASAIRYRASPSSNPLRAAARMFCASTTSIAAASPA